MRIEDEMVAFFDNPEKLGDKKPVEWFAYFNSHGLKLQPLSRGSCKDIPFILGGGFKVLWDGDRILQYHPCGSRHHNAKAYWKLSSGTRGTNRYNTDGSILEED
jgi:hypothetical protein